ncbi:26S proteasome non-ATPase regulatory subunit 9 [Rhizoclosmatium sp. JEL0117]|nr:26S proteasome non-ATPase regulatory subunit 9 [Rhizoclosmatium sp. JEL0117]
MMSGTTSEYDALVAERATIESELSEMLDALKTHNTNMTDPLVDAQGFPRADIDVYTVRHLRSAIIRRQNDHKAVMTKLEAEMHRVFALLQNSNSAPPPMLARGPAKAAFAVVNSVAPQSPAATAGLAPGDNVLDFGGVVELANVASVVREGVSISVEVKRGAQVIKLNLTPQQWSGRGLLGCHLLPL